ncbi:tRNA uracil 4-sulfurtransferase ThiI [Ruminiclostridium cellobioparum]|uniref:Probable tRNA sulfurtransferase n=1 Tax=Ruminiclostridium cellobioparum subsp. termitidis CT1112 TaxID=1195236 RepID=S0FVF1_RUMCE|nr:tRNA uracil 4-sulfurtransferase ThiI [Ruminiclostridium cellobioparum]EMS74261.1 thiazole biosynthesis/tRNA modification protein ThiI [Ruminiclostridium cellobioparum subsp. termitidis CT1112]
MKRIILVRYGEIILKGLNRPVFEDKLIGNIRSAILKSGNARIFKSQGRIYIEPQEENYDFDFVLQKITRIFGVVSVSPVWKIDTDYDQIKATALKVASDLVVQYGYKTFKLETKRGNKKFPMQSPEISADLGGYILENIPGLTVDVKNPDFTVHLEVRESSYVYSDIIKAHGGMPMGSNGKATLLLSGGIDSPVAGWMMGKRGVEIEAVHFYSYPYTSERAKQKVVDLAQILSQYCGKFKLHVVPFTEIQLAINDNCPEDQLTIIMRRIMMRIAEIIARKTNSMALITGESMGQVASQTMQSLYCTDSAVNMPVFRPLIGMDKVEVIDIARKIDTFETSILPYEDCCTVFVAKHPQTKPKLEKIMKSEAAVDFEPLIERAVEATEVIVLKP